MPGFCHTFPKRFRRLLPKLDSRVGVVVYRYYKEEGQKSITQETALMVWELLLKGRSGHYENWVKFLNAEHNKPISKVSSI